MVTKHDVISVYDKHPTWNAYDIAAYLQCSSGYVRATLQRNKLPARNRQRAARPAPAPTISAEERAERLIDERDLDILKDVDACHSERSTAKFHRVPVSRVRKLREAARAS